MPRPLIIKIKNSTHQLDESRRSPLHTNLSKNTSKSLPRIDNYSNNNDVAPKRSLVQSLISMYEDQNFSKPNLVKSKSLPYIDLVPQAKPFTVVTPGNDSTKSPLHNGRFETDPFDFQTSSQKFETSTKMQKNKVVKTTEYHISDLKDIQDKACALIEDYSRVRGTVWEAQVLLFLKSVCLVNADVIIGTNENTSSEKKKEVKNEVYEQTVKGMTDFFERQNSGSYSTSVPEKSFEKYFTGTSTSNNVINDNVDTESSSSDSTLSDSDSENENGNKFHEKIKPVMKIVELKSYFESKKDSTVEKHEVVENTEKIVSANHDKQEQVRKDPHEMIKELVKEIEHYESEIKSISKENIDKGSEINEELIRILIQLDDVLSSDEAVRIQRKDAIAFVQRCIRLLRDKMRN
ncbi:hypothetical protein RN001_013139 [Aquatica leii]|uniref:BAG domain-containing protein n=1 Tax=Aquatica leii TaxID=1421715 RepID=A0AAN7SDN9_9COLE|nr:hypothetical protein RN001_013139 [Aquatica leii]